MNGSEAEEFLSCLILFIIMEFFVYEVDEVGRGFYFF
jgi:hypothetical protein